jgi:small ligand-binding sensory domain FIST
VTPTLRVTRSRGRWIVGLDGRPALEVYEEAAAAAGLGAGSEVAPPLLLGLSADRDGPAAAPPDGWLVRNVVGLDRERGAISVPEPVASGQEVVLMRLDAEAAHRDFVARLAELADPARGFGLYFNCQARGASLFGRAGVEATELANAFADCPVAGVSGPFQIAPFGSRARPAVLTYAGALAVAGRRSA